MGNFSSASKLSSDDGNHVESEPVPAVEEGEIKEVEKPEEISPVVEEKAKESLRINTTVTSSLSPDFQRRRPDPLDLSGTRQPVTPALPSALITARNIENLDCLLPRRHQPSETRAEPEC